MEGRRLSEAPLTLDSCYGLRFQRDDGTTVSHALIVPGGVLWSGGTNALGTRLP